MLKKIKTDAKSDSMYLYLNEKQINHSVELYPDTIILDVAEDQTVVGIELCNISRWLGDPMGFEPEPHTQNIPQLMVASS